VSSQYFRFSARTTAEPRRAAFLERVLARADAFTAVSDWRADAFKMLAPREPGMPAVAATALFAERNAPEAGRGAAEAEHNVAEAASGAAAFCWVCLATPVHYVADMTSVRLPRHGILSLPLATAVSLAADFNRVWQDSGCRMIAGESAHLYCVFDRTLEVATRDPEEVLERYIEEYLPLGADAPRLRQLMSEIEMWLFEQQTNRSREAASLPRINGLWLWGGGVPLAALPTLEGRIAGEDVFFNALASRAAENAAGGVIVTSAEPGGDGWSDAEQRWLKPALSQLRSGTLSRLELSAGRRSFTLTARALRRFWRRSRPWWESFA
jgi:hypothetical protein